MNRLALAAATVATLLAYPACATDRMISQPSAQSVKASLDKLEGLAQSRGLKIFARIDHAAGAQSIGEKLRPTELLIFGHPKGGTPLLQCSQSYGIELPLHVLAWEDSTGRSWLSYKDMPRVAHDRPRAECDEALKRLAGMLDGLVREAAKESPGSGVKYPARRGGRALPGAITVGIVRLPASSQSVRGSDNRCPTLNRLPRLASL